MSGPQPAEAAPFLARLEAVARRLERCAVEPAAAGLTEPDPASGERWEQGQVWAHLAELVPYWVEQARLVLAAPADGAPFGRTKADPGRLGAIERDRARPVALLHARLSGHLEMLRELLTGMSAAGWERSGTHPTLGRMRMERIVDEFLVGHLEEHAAQLEALRGG